MDCKSLDGTGIGQGMSRRYYRGEIGSGFDPALPRLCLESKWTPTNYLVAVLSEAEGEDVSGRIVDSEEFFLSTFLQKRS